MNFREIFNVIGLLLIMLSALMMVPLITSLFIAHPVSSGHITETSAFGWSAFLSGITGLILYWTFPHGLERFRDPEGFVIVALAWVFIAFFGAIPFYLAGIFPSFLDAYFESMSGFTTTGATLLERINILPPGILLWRSMTQWLGGMGIIMLFLAIFPVMGVGGMHLFRGEIPGGQTVERIESRLTETAKLLWKTYLLLTGMEVGFLTMGGMSFYDALCHSFSTMSTGGFSPYDASMGKYDQPFLQWVVLIFMVLAGMNFLLHFQIIHGRLEPLRTNREFWFYLAVLSIGVALVYGGNLLAGPDSVPISIREAAFTVVSMATTTGFTVTDYTYWPGGTQVVLLALMMIGGCSGSTSGSAKCIRILLLGKTIYRELMKLIYPQAVLHIKVGNRNVEPEMVFNALCLIALYTLLAGLGFFLLAMLGLDWTTALSASFTCLFNVGPGMGLVGPSGNYAFVPDAGKGVLILWMLMGRLEIFGVLLLFLPKTWRK